MRSSVLASAANDWPPTLPAVGMCRWDTLSQFVPITDKMWRKLANAAKARKLVTLSERCTMYPNAEIYRWLSDSTGCRA